MATTARRPIDPPRQPDGVEGEGMDPYPTYRDGPTTPHRATTSKPTDVGLPIGRRTYALPILIGLAVFALVIIARVLWGGFQMAESTDEAMNPGDAPAVSAPAAPAASETGEGSLPESEGSLDEDVQLDTTTGPAAVGAEPGPVDVPGGGAGAGEAPAPQ
jgi:hypothetical protein